MRVAAERAAEALLKLNQTKAPCRELMSPFHTPKDCQETKLLPLPLPHAHKPQHLIDTRHRRWGRTKRTADFEVQSVRELHAKALNGAHFLHELVGST